MQKFGEGPVAAQTELLIALQTGLFPVDAGKVIPHPQEVRIAERPGLAQDGPVAPIDQRIQGIPRRFDRAEMTEQDIAVHR